MKTKKSVGKKVLKKSIYKVCESKISKGVKFLDKQFGKSKWAKKIDLSSFTLDSNFRCILAQLYKGKWDDYGVRTWALKKFGMDVITKNGFDLEFVPLNERELLEKMWYVKISQLNGK